MLQRSKVSASLLTSHSITHSFNVFLSVNHNILTEVYNRRLTADLLLILFTTCPPHFTISLLPPAGGPWGRQLQLPRKIVETILWSYGQFNARPSSWWSSPSRGSRAWRQRRVERGWLESRHMLHPGGLKGICWAVDGLPAPQMHWSWTSQSNQEMTEKGRFWLRRRDWGWGLTPRTSAGRDPCHRCATKRWTGVKAEKRPWLLVPSWWPNQVQESPRWTSLRHWCRCIRQQRP